MPLIQYLWDILQTVVNAVPLALIRSHRTEHTRGTKKSKRLTSVRLGCFNFLLSVSFHNVMMVPKNLPT